MKNEKAYEFLKTTVKKNDLKPKGGIKTGWGYMALSDTPNAKFLIKDSDKVRKIFHPYLGKFNMWFQTSPKYITVYVEDRNDERYAVMSIANSRSLHIA